MSSFNCPHCNQSAFSSWDKYLAAKWKILKCPHCEKRVCSAPLLLALFYLLYLADILNFGYLTFAFDNWAWGVAAIVGWVILDLFSVYLPLAAMGSKSEKGKEEDDTVLKPG